MKPILRLCAALGLSGLLVVGLSVLGAGTASATPPKPVPVGTRPVLSNGPVTATGTVCFYSGLGGSNIVTGTCGQLNGHWEWDPTNNSCSFFAPTGGLPIYTHSGFCNFGLPTGCVPPDLTPVSTGLPAGGDDGNPWTDIPSWTTGTNETIVVDPATCTYWHLIGGIPVLPD